MSECDNTDYQLIQATIHTFTGVVPTFTSVALTFTSVALNRLET